MHIQRRTYRVHRGTTYLDWFPPQHDEALRPLHHESRELVTQDPLNLVRLLNLDTESNGVDRRLDEDTLVLVS